MTIASTTTKVSYNGSGSVGPFSIPFKFAKNADIVATKVSTAGVESTLALTTHYTLTGAGAPSGGTLTLVTALATGEKLVIKRSPAQLQETDYVENAAFPAEAHEAALDLLTMICQSIQEQVDRAVTIPISSSVTQTDYLTTVEGYKDDAETAATAAQTAQGLAETAKTAAQGYANDASDSADAAAQSALDAAAAASGGAFKVSSNDSTPGYVEAKLIAGSGIVMTTQNDAANETRTVAVDVGTTANKIMQLDSNAKIPALDGSQLTNLPNSGGLSLSMMTAMLVWRNASKASGAIPSGYLNTFQTDELATKTNAIYDAANKLYSTYVAPAYANTYGSGDRTATITLTGTVGVNSGSLSNLIDGVEAGNTTDAMTITSAAVAGLYFQFQFPVAVNITETTWVQSATTSLGTWKWRGSTDGTNWTDIGSSFTLGGATSQVQTQLAANTAFYTYYQLIGVSGNGSTTPWLEEIKFKIAGAAQDITLKPTAVTAGSAPSTATLSLAHTPVDAVTLGTDLKARCSCDGGSTWSEYATITNLCDYDATTNFLQAVCDLTTATSGTSIQWEVTTYNTKKQSVSAVGALFS